MQANAQQIVWAQRIPSQLQMAEALADAYHKGLDDRWQRLMRVVAAVAANEAAVDFGQQERLWWQIQEQHLEQHLEMRLAALTAVPSSSANKSEAMVPVEPTAKASAADSVSSARSMQIQRQGSIGKQFGKARIGSLPNATTCSPLAMLMSTVFSPMKVVGGATPVTRLRTGSPNRTTALWLVQ
jgi:hypothetical protein